jgi:hypothetical protein
MTATFDAGAERCTPRPECASRRRRHRHRRRAPLHRATHYSERYPSLHAQLDLFDTAVPADPLLGLAVKPPNTCSKCADLVAIIGPGKPPHSASLLCRSCGLHRGWIRARIARSSMRSSTSLARRVSPLSFVLAVQTRSRTTTELVSFQLP